MADTTREERATIALESMATALREMAETAREDLDYRKQQAKDALEEQRKVLEKLTGTVGTSPVPQITRQRRGGA